MKSPCSVVVAAFLAVLTGTAAAAQQTGTLGETVATFCDPDLNRTKIERAGGDASLANR